jgi:hypothetical protein
MARLMDKVLSVQCEIYAAPIRIYIGGGNSCFKRVFRNALNTEYCASALDERRVMSANAFTIVDCHVGRSASVKEGDMSEC